MKQTHHYALMLAGLLAGWTTLCSAGGDVGRGEELSTTCVACHNADGNASNPEWPKIAGQYENYLYEQLIAFRAGSEGPRNNPVMYGIVANYSDQDLADLAAYYAEQTMSPGEADMAFAAHGRELYMGGNIETGVTACMSCHGPAGLGNDAAGYPRVGGQWAPYLKQQLMAFKSGERQSDAYGIMRLIAQRMSDEEIHAVSEYMAGLSLQEK